MDEIGDLVLGGERCEIKEKGFGVDLTWFKGLDKVSRNEVCIRIY